MARAARAAKLTAVTEDYQQNLDEVRDFADGLSDQHLQCREMNHNWKPHQVGRYKDGGFRRVLRCSRCRTKKIQELTSRGMLMGGARYEYPDGYQHKGMGQIVGEGRGVLRLASVMRWKNIQQLDED